MKLAFDEQISGQDKPAQSASMTTTPGSNIPHKSRRYTVSNMDSPQHSVKVSPSCKVSAYASNYSQGISLAFNVSLFLSHAYHSLKNQHVCYIFS